MVVVGGRGVVAGGRGVVGGGRGGEVVGRLGTWAAAWIEGANHTTSSARRVSPVLNDISFASRLS